MMQRILIVKILQKEPLQITLTDKAFNIAKDPKYDGYQSGLASMVYKCFDKISKGSCVNIKSAPQNQQLAKELHKPIIRKLKKRKVHAAFKDNIWGADLADMQLISKYNKGVGLLMFLVNMLGLFL